jgi:DNA polymerase-3 subunit delta
MKLSTDRLGQQLESSTATAWLVAGDEPLLVGEAADAIRARARQQGYTGRETFFVERYFDWGGLQGASQALSLFAERRILEIRMPTARPGVEGGAVLARLAADTPPDTWVLVVTARLDKDAARSAWVKSFDQHGVVVQAWPVDIGQLPDWITSRARSHGLDIGAAGAQLLAERIEGNLLAAHQEIEKLALTHGPGRVSEEDVAAAVANSARYDVFKLGEAALAGDAARTLRILDGLRGEGTEPTLVLWVLCREIRALAQAKTGGQGGPVYGWQAQKRLKLLDAAVRRMRRTPLGPLIGHAARVDRAIKGRGPGDAWDELAWLAARLAGVELPPARAG